MCHRNRILVAALVAAFTPLAAPAAVLCVNPGGTSGCFPTISSAVAAAAFSGDTIAVAAGTYKETGIVVDKPVQIVGAGAGATIVDGKVSDENAGTVFFFRQNSAQGSSLRDLTVTGGRRGIDLTGGNTVTLERLRVTANGPETGAGIFNGSSTMYLRDSLVDANFATDTGSIGGCDWGGASGGGIASLCGGGSNYISGSTIANNTAGRWGGGLIVNDGVTVIENSTISGNQANFPDPGLAGGALFMGGAFPDVTIRFSTIANNGAVGAGGLWADNKLKVFASLLQGNAGAACTGAITSLGYNVVSDASCGFTATGDAQSTDAMLQPLADNGGDMPTHALPAISPAVDRVPAANCTVAVDQEGVTRPQHHACDSGAYERAWTLTDLAALLISQLTGTTAGNSHVAQVSAILGMVAQRQPRAACLVLRMLEADISRNVQRGKIPAGKAEAIGRTVDDLQASLGC
jgi:hypothetical protein